VESWFNFTGNRAMAKAVSNPILRVIRQVALDQGVREASDHDLLERFNEQRDAVAFHALLHRHGPMVFDVCRGVLGNEASAEDAFQAAFLILARKAASIRKGASLGSWLHSVAYRTALQARGQEATRKKSEARAQARPISEPDDLTWREVRAVLHEELNKLPERYRAALVMCYLEGKTQDQAAAQLRLAKSTLKERLERARKFLRARLVRRGLGPPALLVAAAWPAPIVSACLPSTLVSATVNAVGLSVAGQATAGVISAKVAALTEGVMRTMFLTKLKIATAILVVIALIGGGVTGAVMPGPQAVATSQVATKQDDPEKPMEKPISPSRSLKGEFKILSLSFGGDGKALATVTMAADSEPGDIRAKNAVRLWDVQSGNERILAEDQIKDRLYNTFAGVGLSPDGKTVAAPAGGRFEGERWFNWLVLWDAETGKIRHKLAHYLEVRALAFSRDSKLVASGTGGNAGDDFETVKLWDVQTGKLLGTLKTTHKEAGKVAFAPDAKLLAAVLYSGEPLAAGEVVLWDPAEEKPSQTLPDSEGIEAIAFSSDGKVLLGAARNKLRRWDVATGKNIEGPDLKTDFTDKSWSAYAFSPDGNALAISGQREGEYLNAVYDVKTAKRLKTLAGCKGHIWSLSFSPDGNTLAAASVDEKSHVQTIHLWDFDRR
jgi:RNA polymerase sigma factor (sigma-70 family)